MKAYVVLLVLLCGCTERGDRAELERLKVRQHQIDVETTELEVRVRALRNRQ